MRIRIFKHELHEPHELKQRIRRDRLFKWFIKLINGRAIAYLKVTF